MKNEKTVGLSRVKFEFDYANKVNFHVHLRCLLSSSLYCITNYELVMGPKSKLKNEMGKKTSSGVQHLSSFIIYQINEK